MGQHKYNQTAIAAKNGELPEKPKRPSKRECEAEAYAALMMALHKKGLLTSFDLVNLLGNDNCYGA